MEKVHPEDTSTLFLGLARAQGSPSQTACAILSFATSLFEKYHQPFHRLLRRPRYIASQNMGFLGRHSRGTCRYSLLTAVSVGVGVGVGDALLLGN